MTELYGTKDLKEAFALLPLAVHLAIVQPKGGVGKTTLCFNLSSYAAETGLRVLLIDQDQSCNLTQCFMDDTTALESPSVRTLYQTDHRDTEAFAKVRPTRVRDYESTGGYIDLLPSYPDLTFADQSTDPSLFNKIKHWTIKLGLAKQYDLIISDNPGHFGTLNMSAMTAANCFLSPLEMTEFGRSGIRKVLDYIDDIRDFNNPGLQALGYIPFKVDEKNVGYRVVREKIIVDGTAEHLLNKFDSQIFTRVSVRDSVDAHKPVWEFKQSDAGAKAAGQNFREVMNVVLAKLTGVHGEEK